ncbi:MAG: putative ABC transporter permease [Lachnospiraceae bacterium]|nr:putative ABC transporter permease [Lachnospiraceae bacterium]
MKYNILDLGIMVAIISFLGFVVENVWLAITKGYMNNRNMNAPFLLGYGLVVLFLYFVLGTPANPVKWGLLKKTYSKKIQYIVYFLCSFVVVCIGEIILGTIVEWLCGFEYWNYSNIPMHITKYTSIPTSTGFATMITFFMGECFTPLMNWITRLHSIWLRGISVGLMVIMISDFLISFYHMIVEKDFYLKWKIVVRDNREMTKI